MTTDKTGGPGVRERFDPIGAVVHGANALGASLICGVMVLMCADVASRNLLNKPIPGVAEIVASAIVVVVFLQLASAVRHNRLTRVEMLIDPLARFFPRLGRALGTVFLLIGGALCFGIAYWTVPRLTKAWDGGEFVGIVGILTFPRWPIIAIVVFGALLAGFQYVVMAWNVARGAQVAGETLKDGGSH